MGVERLVTEADVRGMPRGGELQNVRILLLPSAGATRPTMTLSMKNASFDNETFRGLLRTRGVECRAPSGYAEAFHGDKLRLL